MHLRYSSAPLVYIYVWTYVGRPSHIIVLARWSTLSQASLNRILWLSIITCKIELVTALNSTVGAVRTKKLAVVPFLFELVGVVSYFVIVISPTQQYLLENSSSTILTRKVSLV